MNKEIKKISDKFKPELKGNGNDTEYEMGWNEAILFYELDFDKALEKAYLQGAKGMREAVKIKDINRNYSDSCQAGFNIAVKELDSKAQQFIDSLEGKDGVK